MLKRDLTDNDIEIAQCNWLKSKVKFNKEKENAKSGRGNASNRISSKS